MTYLITYWDAIMDIERARTCHSLEEALNFIKFRALRPNLYNDFRMTIGDKAP